MSKPFHIYQAGAGSGKTYTLTKSFLTIALSRPQAFRNILGVTFTNKATEEMKGRIVSVLKRLSSGEQEGMAEDLCKALEISKEELQERARGVLTDILHQYGRFSIVTIDSFFHQVIRSFAREIGLQGSFTIDLELDQVMQEVIDQMMMDIGLPEQRQLRKWLTRFAHSKVQEGKSWDFRKEITTLGREIFSESFKAHQELILKLSKEEGYFEAQQKILAAERKKFENHIQSIAKKFDAYLHQNGLTVKDFFKGANGPAGLFVKLAKLDIDISDTRRNAQDNIALWLTKANQKNAQMVEYVDQIMPIYNEIIEVVDRGSLRYFSIKEVQQYFFTFGILAEITRYLQKYRDENDVMLIADLPDFLNQIIRDSDTPYIYEKVGSVFQHYLIDEFQDTSAFQWRNFMPLVKNATDELNFSMVVGDVKQSIYRFRGGDWELLQSRVADDIGDYHATYFPLKVNYRSQPNIIKFNNQFFERAVSRSKTHFLGTLQSINNDQISEEVEKQIISTFATYQNVSQEIPKGKDEDKGSIQLNFIDEDQYEEESWEQIAIQNTIEQVESLQKDGFQLRDIAILTRYANQGTKIANAFIEYRNSPEADPQLSYEIVSSEALYLTSSHLVRFIVSLLQWLNNEKNQVVLSQWLYEYHHYVRDEDHEVSEVFASSADWKSQVPKLFITEKERLKTLPIYEMVERIIAIFSLNSHTDELTYLQGFQDAVLDYSKNERGDITSFLEWWEEVRKDRSIQIADENNAVKILTIHKSKGLEFPVVILPFLNWEFDNDTKKDNILWCASSDKDEILQNLPIVPLKYKSDLVHTYWAEDYYQEKLKAYLDNLNLLYVALTRPIEVLIGYGKKPSKPDQLKYAYDLLYLEHADDDLFDKKRSTYKLGSISSPSRSLPSKTEFGLSSYAAYSWREKVSLQTRGSAELSEATFVSAIRDGIRLHEVLSRVTDYHSLAEIRPEDRQLVVHIVTHDSFKKWFDERWEVHNEVPILLPDGSVKRIDRINISQDETIVIDFKTGEQRMKDQQQVKEYIDILEEMGFKNVSGYLLYLQTFEEVEVT